MHRHVVEKDQGIVVLAAHGPEPLKIGRRVRVTIHLGTRWAPVEAEVREAIRGRFGGEGIDDMDELEVLANRLYEVGRPWPAWLPGAQGPCRDRSEEVVDRGHVLGGRSERGRRLEEDGLGTQDVRDRTGRVPCLVNHRSVLESPIRRELRGGDGPPRSSVRRRCRGVGDELGSLHAENEPLGRRVPPTLGDTGVDRAVERLLDFHRTQVAEHVGLPAAEAARPRPNHARAMPPRNYKDGRCRA